MILVIGNNKEIEKVIEESRFSDLGVWERQHVEEWVIEYPEILGEELLIVTSEYDRFNKTNDRLDILAIDKNGKLVIIELKRDVAQEFVDLQAIHYAAYCSNLLMNQVVDIMLDYTKIKEKIISKEEIEIKISEFITNSDFTDFDNQPRIILAANDFKETTLSAILWLRDSGVDITCVKLEPYKIEEKIVITSDVIIPLSEAKDFIIEAEEKRKTTSQLSHRQKAFFEFWTKILNRFKDESPELKTRSPSKGSWLSLASGHGNIHFEWVILRKPLEEFHVSLHFENAEYEENKKVIEYFESRKDSIQKEFSEELVFQKRWGKRWAQIFISRESGSFDNENIEWGVDRMVQFYKIMKPLLDDYFLSEKE